MLSIINRKNISLFLFVSGLSLLAIGLPLGKSFINIAEGAIGAAWLLEKDHMKRFRSFFTNKITLFIFAVYALHIIGIFYSSDTSYALDDVRKKLPLLIITFVISTSQPLTTKQLHWVLSVFCAAVITSTLISFGILHGVITSKKVSFPVTDIRGISIFVSHIRLSLFCALSICILFFYIVQKNKFYLKVISSAGIVWLMYYMMTTASLTGIIILGIILFVLCCQRLISAQTPIRKKIVPGFMVIAYLLVGAYIMHIYRNNVHDTTTTINDTKTDNGNNYEVMNDANQTEDGKRVYVHFSHKEIYAQWPRYSTIPLDSPNAQHGVLLYTLIRYMTSLDLKKDSAGLSMLNPGDIKNIEAGYTNYRQPHMNAIERRVYEIVWELEEYKNTSDANGHTLAQRYVYWKSGLSIIKQNLLFGIGTGDVQNELFDTYQKNEPALEKKYYWRTHNQYITITIALGLVGLTVFLLSLLYPFFINKNYNNPLYLSFFIILMVSMFTEDTLETLAGVSFYAFFNSLFLFVKTKE